MHHFPAVGQEAAGEDFVGRIDLEHLGFLVPKVLDQCQVVVGKHLAGMEGDVIGQVLRPDEQGTADPLLHPGLGALDVSARGRRHVDDHAARTHGFQHGRSQDARRRPAENLRGGDHHVRLRHLFGHHFTLLGQLLLGQRFGIALRRLPSFTEVDLHKFGSQTQHLLFHRRTRVECFHLCAEALRGGDSLQTGHPRADNKYLGRGNRARGGHHHGKDPVEALGRENDRRIPR